MKKKKKCNNGLSIENNAFSHLSPSTLMIQGKPHSKGGTDINYMGNQVEAESGEPLSINAQGEAVIFGAMKMPYSNTTFKSAAKNIAKEENRGSNLSTKGLGYINNSDPYNSFSALKYNAGIAMQDGGAQIQTKALQDKEVLGNMQQFMLDMADKSGKTPQAISNSMAKGGKIKAKNGTSLAERHNNPGNLKYASWMKDLGATRGELSKENDGTYFAHFPDTIAGQQAMVKLLDKPMYKNKTVYDALNMYTGHSPYSIIPQEIRNKKISELDPNQKKTLFNTITQGEDSKMYNWDNINGPIQPQNPSFTIPPPDPNTDIPYWESRYPNAPRPNQPTGVIGNNTPQTPSFRPSTSPVGPNMRKSSLADSNKFRFDSILPEIAAIADRPDFVQAQQYNPQLFQPYQVSFQDRLNENNSSFRAVTRSLPNNPEALSILAGQKYGADAGVLADQFRTNQGISNDVTNKNVSLLNDAQLKNLQIRDQQYVRQEQAKANTSDRKYAAASSIANKIALNRKDNNSIRMEENLFNYRFNPQTGQMDYVGDPASFNFGQVPPAGDYRDRIEEIRNPDGTIKETKRTYYPSQKATKKFGGFMKKMK